MNDETIQHWIDIYDTLPDHHQSMIDDLFDTVNFELATNYNVQPSQEKTDVLTAALTQYCFDVINHEKAIKACGAC